MAPLTASLFSILDLSWIRRRVNASPVLPRPVASPLPPPARMPLPASPGVWGSPSLCPPWGRVPALCPPPALLHPPTTPTPACVPTEREVTLSPRPHRAGGEGAAGKPPPPPPLCTQCNPPACGGDGPPPRVPIWPEPPPSPAPRPCRHEALGRGGDKGLPRAAPACLWLGCHGAPSPLYIYKYNLRNKPETTRAQRCVLAGGTDQSSRNCPPPGHGEPPRFPRTEHRDVLLPARPLPSSPSVCPSIRLSFPPASLGGWERICSVALAGDGGLRAPCASSPGGEDASLVCERGGSGGET